MGFLVAIVIPAAATHVAALALRTCFADIQWPASGVGTVQSLDRLGSLSVVLHLHKSKTAGSSRIAIGDDGDTFHLSKRLKHLTQVFLGHGEREIPDKNLFHLNFFLDCLR